MADAIAAEIEEALRAARNPARSEPERRYLKSTLEHLGAGLPGIRRVVQERSQAISGHDGVIATAEVLWARPVFDCRMAAVELLDLHQTQLQAQDIDLIERMLRESHTWALVDSLAASVAGPLVERYSELTATLDRWATDEDFWIRRSAMLALLVALRRGGGDFERFARYADAMLDETKFFIRKAIGWVLRDTARKRPDLVYEWLLPRAARASGVTVREAVKRLTPEQAAAIKARR